MDALLELLNCHSRSMIGCRLKMFHKRDPTLTCKYIWRRWRELSAAPVWAAHAVMRGQSQTNPFICLWSSICTSNHFLQRFDVSCSEDWMLIPARFEPYLGGEEQFRFLTNANIPKSEHNNGQCLPFMFILSLLLSIHILYKYNSYNNFEERRSNWPLISRWFFMILFHKLLIGNAMTRMRLIHFEWMKAS